MAHADTPDFGPLLAAANRGDAEAYNLFLQRLTPVIRQIVRRQRFLVGADDIEDVVQEVLLSIHSVRATYDAERPFMPWLLAIVRRRVIDAARRRIRKGDREVTFDEQDVTFASVETNTHYEELAQADVLRVAIERLPHGQRQAVDLLKIREMTLREASAATGMSIGALKVAVHRAMNALRTKLKRHGD